MRRAVFRYRMSPLTRNRKQSRFKCFLSLEQPIGSTLSEHYDPRQMLPRERREGETAPKLPTREETGRVLASVRGTQGEYKMTGKELYVRAVITSDQPPQDPVWKEQKQQAWTQPVGY